MGNLLYSLVEFSGINVDVVGVAHNHGVAIAETGVHEPASDVLLRQT